MELPDQATPSAAHDGWSGGGSPYLELCSVKMEKENVMRAFHMAAEEACLNTGSFQANISSCLRRLSADQLLTNT